MSSLASSSSGEEGADHDLGLTTIGKGRGEGKGKAQSEANVLIMELKKFEGVSSFLTLEKDLILRAMEDSKNIDPALAARGVEQAEARRQQIEDEIALLNPSAKARRCATPSQRRITKAEPY